MPTQTLIDYRKQQHMTLRQLADEMDINSSTLHRIEHNIGNQTTRKVLDWCRQHNINPDVIFPPEASA